jgi:CRP/FNR family transcriptional regulator, cyclic AMP receptor protein
MAKRARQPKRKRKRVTFDVDAFLSSSGAARVVRQYPVGAVMFAQGDPADDVVYIQAGGIRLSVVSRSGREAVVAMLGPGDFVGESVLAGHPLRMATATAVAPTTAVVIQKQEMLRVLHTEPTLASRFLSYVLARNVRVEADLVDQLFNRTEKRLARALLLLARYGKDEAPNLVLPRISQEVLAEMVGTTRSRVNFFMNKFRRLGFIDYNGRLQVNRSLLSVVLHD